MGELMSQGINAKQPAADRREIRVFISSTFRDMHEEREELVKQIFPQLRRLCESRGVTWGEVDLRWGGGGRSQGRRQGSATMPPGDQELLDLP
jgi:hypothetical protein